MFRVLAATFAGILGYLFSGNLGLEARLPWNKMKIRATGAFASFVLVLSVFYIGLPPSNDSPVQNQSVNQLKVPAIENSSDSRTFQPKADSSPIISIPKESPSIPSPIPTNTISPSLSPPKFEPSPSPSSDPDPSKQPAPELTIPKAPNPKTSSSSPSPKLSPSFEPQDRDSVVLNGGWWANYYRDKFGSLLESSEVRDQVRRGDRLSLDWGGIYRRPSMLPQGAIPFSMEVFGSRHFAGRYCFSIETVNFAKVYLNNKLILSKWHPVPGGSTDDCLNIPENTYDIKVEYWCTIKTAKFLLSWQRQSI
ncbi:hypothetical protein [Pseudanabaena sp. Chao 1811]|uniref:hypothetical protein n=1 Tax=Pseudanabaena sp. Chao 1811 TaxID=2963092 RepID=UPI0022F3BA5A|nr:hypothetical protein [Pseudanabaena sp. Chao 1811]